MREPERRQLFEQIYQQHKGPMLAVARRVLKSQELAEEAVHDVFLKVVRNFEDLVQLEPPRLAAWLRLAVRYRALDIAGKEERCLPLAEECLAALGQRAQSGSPELENLREALAALPDKYGNVLVLHYIYGYQAREIGQLLGIATNTAEQRLSRGRRMLRKLLEAD